MILLPEKGTKNGARWNVLIVGMILALLLSISGCAFGPPAAGLPKNPEASTHYSKGTRFLMAGVYESAIPELEKAVQIEPTSASAHLNLGIAYYADRQYERALTCWQRSAGLNPYHLLTRYYLGHGLYAVRRFHDAAGEFEMAARSERFRPPYLPFFLQVLSLMRAGEVEKAQTLLAAASPGSSRAAVMQELFAGQGLGRSGKRIADYLLGNLTEEELLSKGSRKGEQRFFICLVIGINNIVKNDIPKANEFLQTVRDWENPTMPYDDWARVNLEHIRGEDKSD